MRKHALSARRGLRLMLLLNAALVLLAAICLLTLVSLSGRLETQKVAERWKGESEQDFAQISCFIPIKDKIGMDDVYTFRYALLDRLHEAGLDADGESGLFVDAWSAEGKASAATALGKGDVSVTAVGGSFFQFHPLRLISGSYIAEGDLMQDRVLLDEELAWLLFGGTELSGMELSINGKPFVVAGVIEREQDFASQKAYTGGMGLFMSYDAYKALDESAGVTCYELVMAQPVKNYALGFAREKFPIGDGVILQNTDRFRAGRLLGLLRQFGVRSMQNLGIPYPYWENAARCMEDWCTLLLLLSSLLLLLPVLTLIVLTVRLLRKGKSRLDDDLLPKWKDRIAESIRVRQRRRWEKRHGMHESTK